MGPRQLRMVCDLRNVAGTGNCVHDDGVDCLAGLEGGERAGHGFGMYT